MLSWVGLRAWLLVYLLSCWLDLVFGAWEWLVGMFFLWWIGGFLAFGFVVVCCGLCIWFPGFLGFRVVVI